MSDLEFPLAKHELLHLEANALSDAAEDTTVNLNGRLQFVFESIQARIREGLFHQQRAYEALYPELDVPDPELGESYADYRDRILGLIDDKFKGEIDG